MENFSSIWSPPVAFGIVERDVYRTNMPVLANFGYLQRLRIKTALVLSPEKPLKEFEDFITENNIEMIHQGAEAWHAETTWKPVSDELVKESLEAIINPAKRPIIIICTSGRHQTGIVVGCLRRLQRWCLTSIFHEYCMFAGEHARLAAQHYIEQFDPDFIALPPILPPWLLPPPVPTSAAAAAELEGPPPPSAEPSVPPSPFLRSPYL
eukprot:m.103565 g.103565  ORF g.103565 m.103565 type:complete len:209 (-) comp14152_c0_seq1:61-687(-)